MKTTPITLAIALAIVPGISAAQILEEVVVTAQKKEENLTEAPVAVAVVSAADIRDLSIFQADELGKLVTGLEVRYEGDSNTGVGMRGVGTFASQTAPARVGTYMDDYYMAGQASVALASMFDMANVQALKGPQGTLYGQPSPTGALLLTTQDPNFDGLNGFVQGSVVDPKGYNVQGAFNIPIGNTFALRIAGLVDERETGTKVKRADDNPQGDHTEERNRSGIRVKALWEPTDTLSIKAGYHYLESSDSDYYRALETFDSELAGFDVEAKDRTALADRENLVIKKEDTLATLKLDWELGNINLSWFAGMLKSDITRIADLDNTEIPSLILDLETKYGGSSDGLQSELRFSGTVFDNWDWVVGAYYGKGVSNTDVFTNAAVQNQGVFEIVLDIPSESTTKAIFTHNAIQLGENTELTVGVRYNEFEGDASNNIVGNFIFGAEILPGGEITDGFFIPNLLPCVDGTPGPCTTGALTEDEEWTGTIKLRHFFSDEFNLYGTLDRGFRPGAPNFDTTGVFQPDLNNYIGESVNSFEIGAKGDLLDGRARYTAAFFYSVYEDYQVPVSFEAHNITTANEEIAKAVFVNVDEAVQRGIEADFRMMVTHNWMLYTGATYTNVEFTDGMLPCTDPSQAPIGPDNRYNTCDADGETASAQPEWTAMLQTEYTFPQLIGSSDAYIGALFNYKGEIEVPGDPAGRLTSDSYTTLDLFTGLRSEKWSAQLFAKNVTDEDGIVAKRPLDFGYNDLTLINPRTIGLTASYHF